jgi:hypothetical protein
LTISRAQALKAGLSERQIEGLTRRKEWHRRRAGVYVVGGTPASWKQDLMVACLAGPDGTIASHRSAAALFGWCDPPKEPEVTVPGGASGRRIASSHHARLDAADRCVSCGIPSTAPARTIVDCAGVMSLEDLCDLVDTACYRRRGLAREIGRALRRLGTRGRRGVKTLREAMLPWTEGVRPGSPAEARCIRAFARWGLPKPERQYRIFDETGNEIARVDFAWPDTRLLFEYDGEEYHGPRAWEDDARWEEEIERLGWTVERGDKEDFRPSATGLRDRLRKLLGVPASP